MWGLDELISGLAAGDSLVLVLGVALLLGIRHSADPDHLIAVSALVAAEPNRKARRAASLGFSWGVGHAFTLLLLGLPVIAFRQEIPGWLQRASEAAVGVVMILLALRLLSRWRRGHFHVHTHEHDGSVHRHLHLHQRGHSHGLQHGHPHADSPVAAGLMGVLQAAGGSGAVVVLLLASAPSSGVAMAGLLAFALGTALSMAALTAGVGYALGRDHLRTRMHALIPVFGWGAVLFGAWYVSAAI